MSAEIAEESTDIQSAEDMAEEFYPELLAIIANMLQFNEAILTESDDAFSTFSTLVNRSLFHIAKHSTLQLVLEEIGWYMPEVTSVELLMGLSGTLAQLYLMQITKCIPCGICGPSDIVIEQHPDLFNDQVATYSYLPNILLKSLLQDSRSSSNSTSLKFEGACMLADISGFTKLSGACCEEGTSGLDRLHDACSGYLGKFVQTVYTYQGDGK